MAQPFRLASPARGSRLPDSRAATPWGWALAGTLFGLGLWEVTGNQALFVVPVVVLALFAGIGGTDYLIGSVTIPTLAGTDGAVAAVNVMGSTMWQAAIYDAFANRVLPLDTSVTLKVKSLVTVTTAKTITIFATAEKS